MLRLQKLTLCLSVLALSAEGMAGSVASSAFYEERWTTDDGLPANEITSLTQTRDRYLWIGTYFGLVRFDGRKFTVFSEASQEAFRSTGSAVTCLAEADDGTLWIGTARGLLYYRAGTFFAYSKTNGLPNHDILSLAAGESGSVWIGTHTGVVRFDGASFQAIKHPLLNNIPVDSMLRSRAGDMWAATREGIVRMAAADERRASRMHQTRPGQIVTSMAEDAAGRVWFNVTFSKSIRVITAGSSGSNATTTTVSLGEASSIVNRIVQSGTNVFVVAHGQLFRLEGTNAIPTARLEERPKSAIDDREGGFWIGTRQSGLVRLTPKIFKTLASTNVLAANVWSVAVGAGGRIWLGTDAGAAWIDGLDSTPQLARYADQDGNAFPVNSLFSDRFGVVWSGRGTHGLWKLDGARFAKYIAEGSRMNMSRINAITDDRQGRLWVGGEAGLHRIDPGRPTGQEVFQGDVRAILEAKDGSLWVGTYGGGASRLADGRWTTFTVSNGLPHNHVYVIREDAEGRLWFGTQNGMAVLDRGAMEHPHDGEWSIRQHHQPH
jgi:ligand-binding sensor domain-containing protein